MQVDGEPSSFSATRKGIWGDVLIKILNKNLLQFRPKALLFHFVIFFFVKLTDTLRHVEPKATVKASDRVSALHCK